MYQPPPTDQSTFESQAHYNLQATEDVEEDHGFEEKKFPVEIPKRPNYRPKPLRWPFIVCVVALLTALMALVIFASTTMPNSDSTATIEPRQLLVRQQTVSEQQSQSAAPEPSASPTTVDSQPAPPASSTTAETTLPSSHTIQATPTDTVSVSSDKVTASVESETSEASTSAPSSVTSSLKSDTPSTTSPITKDDTKPTSSGVSLATSSTPASSSIMATPTSEPKSSSLATESLKSAAAAKTSSGTILSSATEKSTRSSLSTTTYISDTITTTSRTPGSVSKTTTTTSETSDSISSTVSDEAPSTRRHGKVPVTSTTSSLDSSKDSERKPAGNDEIMSVVTSELTSIIVVPAATSTYSTDGTTEISSSYTTKVRTTLPGTTGETTITNIVTASITRVVTRTPAVSFSATTLTMPGSTEIITDTISDEKTTYYQTTTKTAGYVTTATAAVTASEVVETSFEQVESTYTSTAQFTVPDRTTDVTSVGVTVVPVTFPTVATTTQPARTYVQVGTTEITRIITVPGGKGEQKNGPTQPPVVQVITKVDKAKVVTIVDNVAAQTIVTNDGGVFTVAFTPAAKTRVTRVGGQEALMVITITPSPQLGYVAVPTTMDGTPTVVMVASTLAAAMPGVFKEVETTIDGKPTVVNVPVTPEPVLAAVQTIIDGKPTVVMVQTTPTAPGFNPIALTLVSIVGGIATAFTTTDAPETIQTTIDGKEATLVRTPAPRVFTSVSGGTKTTLTLVTTPTASMPLSFTVVTTIGGTLSTIISTPEPTTFTTSILGTLRTFTSTPKPTTHLSTIKPSTTLITTTARPASTGKPDTIITQVEKFAFTDGEYFLGKFLPVILAVMIAVPLRIIDLNAKLYQPFHALAREGGSPGRNSMTLQFDGLKGFLAPFEVLMQGHPVPFITTLIIWCSCFLAPLATEAIGMKLHGTCKITAIQGCGIQLGVSPTSAHALIALLALIIVLLLVLLLLLRNFDTGLHANPWSIAGISSLARNQDIRSQLFDFKHGKDAMKDKRYGFGYFQNTFGRDEYGIVSYDETDEEPHGSAAASGALPADDEFTGGHQRQMDGQRHKKVPFIALTVWWRLTFSFFLACLFVIILYYHVSLGVRTSFKDFMDSQSFGVRFFFAALGVIIIFCWESIFVSIAVISPYHHMVRRPQPPEKSILLTRPTNGFYGLYAAVVEGNPILMMAAFMSILSEFLPILFANVPYNLTQTLTSHNVCARISLSILAVMLLTVVASLFIKWPEMPVDPRSIVGSLYYVNESRMLDDFEGLSRLSSEERATKVRQLGRRYFYGGITGSTGKKMGVESLESVEDAPYTTGDWFLPRIEEESLERSCEDQPTDQGRRDDSRMEHRLPSEPLEVHPALRGSTRGKGRHGRSS